MARREQAEAFVQTRRKRVKGEIFGMPGTGNYLAGDPEPPARVPGDPATLERSRTAKSRAERLRAAPRGLGRKRRR
jgi:hypothetical protein